MSSARAPVLCALLLLAPAARAAPALEADLGDLLRAMPGHYAGMAPKAFQPDTQSAAHDISRVNALT